ncbi:glycosyltransferase family 87 protein [Jiangella gansuensis]|uniref:glycosyltransferase family 87 protein n=1 Tax=Jiangella gansuensis TaxID=281473 RepID=UPI0006880536|nr:glycosyltransferase 87 family protein [Jiangella gansuensis]
MSVTPPRPDDAGPVSPSRDDPVVAAASEWLGGPLGRRAVPRRRWWNAVRVALAVTAVVLVLGFLADLPCRADGWADRDRPMWTATCYSDVPFLYRERGFADGLLSYWDTQLEYPVLTGALMQGSAAVAAALQDVFGPSGAIAGSVWFFDVTAVLMALCAAVVVIATARTVPRRPWDGLLVAASPVLLLSANVNWDLFAVMLCSLAVLVWLRDRPVVAGVLVGLGAAAKLYPVLLLGPMLLLALRAPDRGRALRSFALTAAAAVVAWSVVNLPVAYGAPAGWRAFFDFNRDRGADFGSAWFAVDLLAPGLLPERIDTAVVVTAAVLLVLICALALAAPAPPRLAQLAFLAVAAFLLVNKVWSPQYALWLLPLAVLARPRVRDLAIWQAAEVVYFVVVWRYLATLFDPADPLVSDRVYALVTLLRIAGVLWFAAMVVRDILRPGHDPVRPATVSRRPAAARHRRRKVAPA